MTDRTRILQTSFGIPGSGGPIGALERVLVSDMARRYDFLHLNQPAAGGINLPLIIGMARRMRRFNPAIAHIRGLGNEGLHGVLAARLAGVPKIVLSVHGSVDDLVYSRHGFRTRMVALLEPLSVALATHVITMYDGATHKRALANMGTRWVGSVPNGVELKAFSASARQQERALFGIRPDDVVLIVVARLVVDKGHLDLFEALRQLGARSEKKLHLLVVGDGPDREEIVHCAESVSSVEIHFLGMRQDVAELLAASDIFVFPSLHENLSNALLEAMASGLPVIATSVGATPEVISRGGGILVNPSAPGELRSAVQTLVDDEVLRAEMGARARETVEDRYTVEHMTRRLAEVYERILGE